jgi:hypothetical protein
VLCDAEVALIIFSSRGKLYEFGSAGYKHTHIQLSNSLLLHHPLIHLPRCRSAVSFAQLLVFAPPVCWCFHSLAFPGFKQHVSELHL